MAIIWGVNFSVVKYGTTLLEPMAYNGVRLTIAALLLVAIVAVGRDALPPRRTIVALLLLGVLGNGIYQYLFVQGIARTSASDAALVIASTPAFVAIIGWARHVERTTVRGAFGILLSIGGMGLVVVGTTTDAATDASLLGDLLVLVGSLAWAAYTVLLKPHTERISGMQLSAFTMVGGAVPLAIVSAPAVLRAPWHSMPFAAYGAIGYSAVFSLVVAYLFWYRGVRVLGPTRTAMYSNLQPVVAVIVAWAALGETPTVWQILGAACIMAGLFMTRA